jgi:hypothetical protein
VERQLTLSRLAHEDQVLERANSGAEEEESTPCETTTESKKVISTEKFPNNPLVNFTYACIF